MPAGPGCIHIGQPWSILFLYGVSGFSGRASGLRPLLAIARCEGSACGVVDRVLVTLHSGDALALRPRWRPAFRWLLFLPFMMTTDNFTLPAGRSLCSLSPSARWTGRSVFPGALPGPTGYHHNYCLSLGRGGARSGGREERGILAYPPARREGGRVEEFFN